MQDWVDLLYTPTTIHTYDWFFENKDELPRESDFTAKEMGDYQFLFSLDTLDIAVRKQLDTSRREILHNMDANNWETCRDRLLTLRLVNSDLAHYFEKVQNIQKGWILQRCCSATSLIDVRHC